MLDGIRGKITGALDYASDLVQDPQLNPYCGYGSVNRNEGKLAAQTVGNAFVQKSYDDELVYELASRSVWKPIDQEKTGVSKRLRGAL